MKTLIEVTKLSSDHLSKKGVSKKDAEDLVAAILNLKRIDLYMQHDRPLNDAELDKLRKAIERMSKGEPYAYVIGEVNFLGLKLEVNPSVLIPRVETELWVSEICGNPNIIWDVCTGSGAIGLSLKKRFPDADVSISDISEDALEVAKNNSELNQLKVNVLKGDLFEPFYGKKADLITINPPYISKKDYEGLDRGVKDFEPRMALVGGETGLEFYEKIARVLPVFLNEGAMIYLEIGFDQGDSVKSLFDNQIYDSIEVKRDLSGHPRCLSLKYKGNSLKMTRQLMDS